VKLNIVKFPSECGKHQYASWFYEDRMENPLGVVGLNPSVLKDGKNRTVSILMQIAKREGFDSLFITNLYSYISPDPKKLKTCKKPVLEENDKWIQRMEISCGKILCICGNNPSDKRISEVMPIIKTKSYAIGFTKSGRPRHVLHTRKDAPLIRF
jgi:hypothetical protein